VGWIMKNAKVTLLALAAGLGISVWGFQTLPSFAEKAIVTAETDDANWPAAVKNHFESIFFKRIHATSDQKAKLTDIFDTAFNENKDVRSQLRSQFSSLVDAMTDGKTSEEQLHKQYEEIKATREKLADRRFNTILKVRTVLTPDQLKEVGDRFKSRMSDWKGFGCR
jgi:periplasmic protein CpxP/Spy